MSEDGRGGHDPADKMCDLGEGYSVERI